MRDALHRYLLDRPAGAGAHELLDLIFTQPGADREFGPRFMQTLLASDPRFAFREADQCWIASAHATLARALSDTEFVVVDIETTGGSPQHGDGIIEIGAVRIAGGRLAERFSQLIDPGRRLPFFITQLTGITDDHLAGQPRVADVLPQFLEFVGERVLIAHNANFDLGFLNAAVQTHRGSPLHQPHVCTLRLARRLLPQLRRRGLDTVAAHFGIPLVDRHRALGDAAITAEVWLHFLELLAQRGVTRLDQVLALQASARDGRAFACPLPRSAVTALPESSGIYRFVDADERLLYIGKAKNLRQRVSQYLSNANGHSNKTLDLIRHIHAVRVEITASELEASLREAEAIRSEQPPYNRLRKHLPRIAFLKLTSDAEFPRLMISRQISQRGGQYFGPFRSRESAVNVMGLVTRVFKLRTCIGRLRPEPSATPCLQGQIDACSVPCVGRASAADYQLQVATFLRLMAGDAAVATEVRATLTLRRDAHTDALRFEAAASAQRDLEQFERLLRRQRTLGWVVAQQHFLVMQPTLDREAVVAYLVVAGRLTARGTVRDGTDLSAMLRDVAPRQPLALSAEDVDGTTILAAWLRDRGERDGYVLRFEDPSTAAQHLSEWTAVLGTMLPSAVADRRAGGTNVPPPSEPQRGGDEHDRERAPR
ncbi:MAG: GIY-YIG nuclease family protein [Deltaproteobacteria bacterium]|nr:GIY-YIG nuclease family protein [Deltaproteobacteria bacterium]MBI3391187.1 GIY-YIG nuclease family protein [Deltaproteobacteria bacterium]